jgi:hypothetical protein
MVATCSAVGKHVNGGLSGRMVAAEDKARVKDLEQALEEAKVRGRGR